MTITDESPESSDAVLLLGQLAETLAGITGDSGNASFSVDDVRVPRSVFAMARGDAGTPLGCGALRPFDDTTAEIKRMYAGTGSKGVGTAVLAYLESKAVGFGYTSIVLETRRVNGRAVAFYMARGYAPIPNYGRYIGRPEAICFRKDL